MYAAPRRERRGVASPLEDCTRAVGQAPRGGRRRHGLEDSVRGVRPGWPSETPEGMDRIRRDTEDRGGCHSPLEFRNAGGSALHPCHGSFLPKSGAETTGAEDPGRRQGIAIGNSRRRCRRVTVQGTALRPHPEGCGGQAALLNGSCVRHPLSKKPDLRASAIRGGETPAPSGSPTSTHAPAGRGSMDLMVPAVAARTPRLGGTRFLRSTSSVQRHPISAPRQYAGDETPVPPEPPTAAHVPAGRDLSIR
jgi:hypothetical protein